MRSTRPGSTLFIPANGNPVRRRPRLRRALHTLHRWAGAGAAVLVLLVCVTGVLATFRHEIDWAVTPALRVAPAHAQPDLDAIAAELARAFPDHDVETIALPEGTRFAAVARLTSASDGSLLEVLVHPRSGAVRAVRPIEGVCYSTSDCLRQIHVRLLMGRAGRLVVGGIGVTLVLLLASGALVHVMTRGKRPAKRRPTRRAPMRVHRVLGFATLPFALVIAVTGAVLGLDAWLPSWDADVPRYDGAPFPSVGERSLASVRAHAEAALARRGIRARLESVSPALPRDPDTSFAFTERAPFAPRGGVRVHVELTEGAPIAIDVARDAGAVSRAYDLLDPLHFGTVARGLGRGPDVGARGAWATLGVAMVVVTLSGMAIVVARMLRGAREPRVPIAAPTRPVPS